MLSTCQEIHHSSFSEINLFSTSQVFLKCRPCMRVYKVKLKVNRKQFLCSYVRLELFHQYSMCLAALCCTLQLAVHPKFVCFAVILNTDSWGTIQAGEIHVFIHKMPGYQCLETRQITDLNTQHPGSLRGFKWK